MNGKRYATEDKIRILRAIGSIKVVWSGRLSVFYPRSSGLPALPKYHFHILEYPQTRGQLLALDVSTSLLTL